MPLYELDDAGKLRAPVLVAALDGWIDAGSAATLAVAQLAAESRPVATFDGDRLFDYRARRPTLDVVDGSLQNLDWPELQLVATTAGDRDLLVLTGPEPDYRWRQLSADVMNLVKQLGVTSWISLGALPAAVAHTRPVPILGTASVSGLLPEGVTMGPKGHLRVPSAALSVLELGVARSGIATLGFFAQIPHYVSMPYPGASIELLRHVGQYLDIELPLGDLPMKALETRTLLDAATSGDETTKAHVERLEQMADEAQLPTGDELISDIERFLRRGGDGGTDGGKLPN